MSLPLDLFFQERVAQKSISNPDIIEYLSTSNRNCLVLAYRRELHGRSFYLQSLPVQNLWFLEDAYDLAEVDAVITLGFGACERHLDLLQKLTDRQIYFFEAAFLRSILMDKSGSIWDRAMCFFVDDLGHHYDCNHSSRLELMLNDHDLILTSDQLQRAEKIINTLRSHRITKYNHQQDHDVDVRSDRPRVLVIEQAREDYAILRNGGSSEVFLEMLDAARQENPDADIIIKIHPDTLDNKRGGLRRSYFGAMAQESNIHVITDKINPFRLLATVDKVYVFSSMIGFESLLMNKETHVFGLPCYAGWGLTFDRRSIGTRSTKRSVQELVYIIYVLYTKYIDEAGKWCTVEHMLDYLINLKKSYNDQLDISK